MKNIFDEHQAFDLSHILKPFENKWVALSQDHTKVLGSGDSLEEAEQYAQITKQPYVFIKLPPFDVNYIPSSQ